MMGSNRRNWIGWISLAAWLLIQCALFREFARREVVWSYPPYHDQLTYLGASYDTLERILDHGLYAGLSESEAFRHLNAADLEPNVAFLPPRRQSDPNAPLSPNGAIMPNEAAMLFLLTGPSRLNALMLNFAYFALFECVLVGTLLWLSGRWSIALIALGLLLTCPSQFDGTGGIIDFRLDFSAACLFGIFLCVVIRSRMFADWRWSVVAGLVCAYLIAYRFITAVYLAGAMGLLVLFLLGQIALRRRDPSRRADVVRRLIGTFIAGSMVLLFALPIIIHHFPAIHDYYIARHLHGDDRSIRAAGQGIADFWSAFWYYPDSLYHFHAGAFFIWAGLVLVAFFGLERLVIPHTGPHIPPPINLPSALFFSAACLLVPMAVLSSDQDKTPVVADVMVGPLLWFLSLLIVLIAGLWHGTALSRFRRVALPIAAAVILTTGIATQVSTYASHGEMTQNRREIESILALYDRITDDCQALGLRNPAVACDCQADYLNPPVLKVEAYERRGVLLKPGETMANTIGPMDADDLVKDLVPADFVMLSEHPAPPPGGFEYPFETSVRKAKPRLLEYCRKNLLERGHARLFDRDITLYFRPQLRIEGLTDDGWITHDGMTIVTLADVLRSRPHLRICGSQMGAIPDRPVPTTARLFRDGNTPLDVPARFDAGGGGYKLSIDVNPASLPSGGMVSIEVKFQGPATGPQVDSRDVRGLVMRAPTYLMLEKQSP